MGGIFLVFLLLFLAINPFISWTSLLSVDPSFEGDLSILAGAVMFAFCLKFVFGLVYEVFDARQKIAMIYVFDFIAKAIFLIIILLLIRFTTGSILNFGLARSFTFGLMPVVVGLIFFRTWFRELRPSWRYFHLKYAKALTTLGVKFFVIMVSLLIIRQTNNFLIIRYVGPEYVVQYEAAFKVFSIVVLVFQLATRPLWSAYVEAYHKQDFDWIRMALKQMVRLWFVTLVGVAVVLLFVDQIYDIWLQGKVQVPFLLSALVAITMLQTTWISIFNIFINGTGKIQLQMYITLVASVINIPLSIFLVQYFDMGAAGIVLGSVISLLGTFIMGPIQVRKILNRTDVGIWGK
jgi:O-antigen/teichoic acid export membrane protein